MTVWLRGGLYQLNGGLTLEKEDSGEPQNPIIYRAVENERPRLFGGVRLKVDSFAPVTDPALLARMSPEARGHVLQLRLGEGVARPKRYADVFKGNGGMVQLIRNGRVLPLSRWPRNGYTTMASVVDSGISPARGGTFHYRPEIESHVERWAAAAQEGDLWLTGFWRVPFETESVRVQTIDSTNHTISLAAPIPNGIGSKYVAMVNGTRPGNGKEQYFAFNLFEEINTPGEWSYDFRSSTLYLWPPAPLSSGDEILLANLARPVVTLNGTSDITLQGLTIEGGITQALAILDGRRDLVAGCLIRNTGGGGVEIEGGGSDRVQSSDFEHIGSYGIRIVAGDRKTLTPANDVADNNHIHNYGEQERITQGIYLGGIGNRATHNLIHDGTYHGIEYQGNDETMEYNEIHHVGLDAGDMGVFYTNGDWAAQGNVIAYNFAHHSPNANGSYLDDGSSGRTTFGNVFYKLSVGPFLGGGHNNIIENNLIIDCKTGIHVDDRGVARHYDATAYHLTSMLTTINPDRPPWSTRYPNFLQGILEDPTHPSGNIFENNVILDTPKPYQLSAPDILDPRQNPVFAGDPQFADMADLDFTLKPSSPIYVLLPGFKPIPFAEIGLRLDEYRKTLPTAEQTGRNSDRTEAVFFDSNTDVKASDQLGSPRH